ncbi:MAG TPA: hypothetical protein VFH80_27730 [Solirubrobacteraceae bacterium]|nr:hypothetical protein [Solirubrobacteraceae bacterium]
MTSTRWLPMAAGLLAGLCVCACGSTNSSGTTTNSSSQFALAQCMRSHGVPNFPDPAAGGGFNVLASPGSSTVTIDGVAFGGPAFESAVKTCKLFGGGASPPQLTASQKQKLVAFAQCMRRHGVPGFPDPTFPSSGGVDRGSVPAAATASSPAFQKASQACGRGVVRNRSGG